MSITFCTQQECTWYLQGPDICTSLVNRSTVSVPPLPGEGGISFRLLGLVQRKARSRRVSFELFGHRFALAYSKPGSYRVSTHGDPILLVCGARVLLGLLPPSAAQGV